MTYYVTIVDENDFKIQILTRHSLELIYTLYEVYYMSALRISQVQFA